MGTTDRVMAYAMACNVKIITRHGALSGGWHACVYAPCIPPIIFVVSALLVFAFLCFRWSFADVPLKFFCPGDHETDLQPRM